MASSLFSILPLPGAFSERCCPQLRYPLRFLVYPCLLAVLMAGIDAPPRQSPCQEIYSISLGDPVASVSESGPGPGPTEICGEKLLEQAFPLPILEQGM